MPSNFETLVFEIIAKDAQASAAFDRFRRNVDQTSGAVDRNSASLDKNAQSLDKHQKASVDAKAAAMGLGLALGQMATPLAAAGVGFAAFAGLAVPSVLKITKAIGTPAAQGGLAAAWVTLDNRQKVALQGVQALGHQYTALAKAMEPQVFQVFGTTLGLANSLLGPFGVLAKGAAGGVESLMVQLSAHAGLQQFVTFLGQEAGPALRLLGPDIAGIAHAVFSLLEAFGGTGLAELRLFSDVLNAVSTSIVFLSQHAPVLGNVALTLGGLALALSKIGALSSVLRITGLSAIAGQMAGFAAATEGATFAEKGMLASTVALDAVSPLGWAVLATAAVGGLVFWLTRFKTVTDTAITAIVAQNRAQGFNTAGYFAAATAIGAYSKANEQTVITLHNSKFVMDTGTTTVGRFTGATAQLTAAQQKLVSEGVSQQTFLTALENKYGLTRDAAISLATKSGVLASQVNKGGQSMKDALAQTEAYANANLRAQRPTSQLTQDMADFANKTLTATERTKALTAALTLFFNPAVTADQDTITLKNDQVALAKALDASGGKTGLLTQKQRDARQAFDTYISQVAQTAQDSFNATGKTSSYTRVINDALPALERAAGHNKALREEIQRLIDTERNLRSENIRLTVLAHGKWNLSGQSLPGGFPGGTGAAAGMLVQGGIPGRDSVPILAMPGEAVIDTRRTAMLAPLFRAMGVPGFAAGGVVGSYSDGIGGLGKWVASENAATIRAMADALVVAMHRAATSGFGAGGGALGGDPAANKALARRMFPWPAYMWPDQDLLVMRESGWNRFARNPSSGAYGIPQALPESKLPFAGQSRGGSHAGPQIGWLYGYEGQRYGDPLRAWGHEMNFGWYDQGGSIPPGLSLALNTTGRPERVGGGNTYHITVHVPPLGRPADVGREVVSAIRAFEKGSGAGWRK